MVEEQTKTVIIIDPMPTSVYGNKNNEFFVDGKIRKKYFHRGGSFGYHFSRRLKELKSNYNVEHWKCYYTEEYGEMGIYSKLEDEVLFRQFPAKRLGIGRQGISFSMLSELRQRINSKEKILVHLQQIHSIFSYMISALCKSIPLIGQQRGPNTPPYIKSLYYQKMKYLLLVPFDILSVYKGRYYDHIFACSIGEYNYLRKRLKYQNVTLLKGGGIELDEIKPKNKNIIRKKLNLSQEAKILLFISIDEHLEIKGYSYFLDAFSRLKEEYNINLIHLGFTGDYSNKLIKKAEKLDVIRIPFSTRKITLDYINASDIFLLYTEERRRKFFAGFGTAPLEALALNVPLVSSLMTSFYSRKKHEIDKIGRLPSNKENIYQDIKFILDNPEIYKNTRQFVKKYYTWEKIINHNSKAYGKAFKKYYK